MREREREKTITDGKRHSSFYAIFDQDFFQHYTKSNTIFSCVTLKTLLLHGKWKINVRWTKHSKELPEKEREKEGDAERTECIFADLYWLGKAINLPFISDFQ